MRFTEKCCLVSDYESRFGNVIALIRGLRNSSRGKKFGDEIARSMCIGRQLFHSALEKGGFPTYLVALAEYKDEGMTVAEVRHILLPFLTDGFQAIENKVGRRRNIDSAKLITRAFMTR